jgi:hypothetical protein
MLIAPNKYRLFVSSVLLFLLFWTTGCGLKLWPEPRAEEDRFAWEEVSLSARESCLEIRATLTGAYGNLVRVELELAPSEEDCPSCPFQPQQTFAFEMDDPEITRTESSLTLLYCQLSESAGFRWRIVGYNVHASLQPVFSKVMYVGKKE